MPGRASYWAGVNSVRESQRERHVCPISGPASSTTNRRPRRARCQAMARPAWLPPITTTSSSSSLAPLAVVASAVLRVVIGLLPGRATVKLNIMPLCMCSAMWQCAIHSPGLVTSNKMSTVCPVRTSTVSFHTRFGSATPSRASTRNRPAPCRWNGWCMGWSESISLTSRILTRSPTVNRQSIAALAAPVVRSTSIHRMLAGVVSRLTATMSSSHSMPPPSPWPWPSPWWPCSAPWSSRLRRAGAARRTARARPAGWQAR